MNGMFVCKAFKQLLSPLITEITYSEPVLDQLSLERLANTFTNLKCFIVYQEYDDHLPLLDWSAVCLPHLEHLDLNYCPLQSIEFNSANTPSLQTLCLSHQRNDIQSLKLDLTSLKTLSCSFIQVSVQFVPG